MTKNLLETIANLFITFDDISVDCLPNILQVMRKWKKKKKKQHFNDSNNNTNNIIVAVIKIIVKKKKQWQ